jgi:hypothetical protein
VIIPDLQRSSKPPDNWVLLDRQRGLTLKVPDGRGRLVAGLTFNRFEQRHAWREQFESMRLLYVAATRARDRLILSGTTKDLDKLGARSDTWLNWIWQSLELPVQTKNGVVDLASDLQLLVTLNIADTPPAAIEASGTVLTGTAGVAGSPADVFLSAGVLVPPASSYVENQGEVGSFNSEIVAFNNGGRDARGPSHHGPSHGPSSNGHGIHDPGSNSPATAETIPDAFPLLGRVEGDQGGALHRFSVTQLINYQRCPRQYYFDRILHAPAPDALAVWNNAEAPEPPANLTATLKGAVIHRFCETYSAGDDTEERLRKSFADVVRGRQAELADRLLEINASEAIAELLPLAQNYLSSGVFERIERARAISIGRLEDALESPRDGGQVRYQNGSSAKPRGAAGLWSELAFRLRRPLGILSGAIDKLLITPFANGKGFDIEIIDFKTNRLSRRSSISQDQSSFSLGPRASRPLIDEVPGTLSTGKQMRAGRPPSPYEVEQIAFDFNAPASKPSQTSEAETSLDDRVRVAAIDYELQMQAYVLAVRELAPSLKEESVVVSTLHFLEPNVEVNLTPDLLSPEACKRAIDEAMVMIVSSGQPNEFPVHTATHCRMCNFLSICSAGREWVRSRQK